MFNTNTRISGELQHSVLTAGSGVMTVVLCRDLALTMLLPSTQASDLQVSNGGRAHMVWQQLEDAPLMQRSATCITA